MDAKTFDIRIDTKNPPEYLLRQTPARKGIWGNCRFRVNDDVAKCDFFVVYEGLSSDQPVECPKKNTIFITGEPPGLRRYDDQFLNQFHMVVSSHMNLNHPNVVNMQQALPWLVGVDIEGHLGNKGKISLDYDSFTNMSDPKKDKLVSVIDTGKAHTKGHRIRKKFIRRLVERSKFDIDVFSPEKDELRDKWSALSSYHYHIAMENSVHRNYWTEKISDAFLALAMPLYHGCPNIGDYFPSNSFESINIERIDESILRIDQALESDPYKTRLDQIKQSRDLVANKYNLFNMISEIANATVIEEDNPTKMTFKREKSVWDKQSPLSRRIELSLKTEWNRSLDRLDGLIHKT